MKIVRLLLISLLICHFSILALYHLPDNPLKHQLKFQILTYMNPLFTQEWKLFSPNPISSNMSINYKFQIYNKNKIVHETQWLDSQTPIIQQRKNSFWSPTQRVLKFFSSCSNNVLDQRSHALTAIKESDIVDKDSVYQSSLVKKAMERSYGHKAILSYSRFVYRQYSKNLKLDKIDSVRINYRILSEEFPRFSKRNLDYFDLKNYNVKALESSSYKIL